METLELSRAELWFCAPDTPAVGEARVCNVATGDVPLKILSRLVPSSVAPIAGGPQAYELFTQRESRRGKTAILRRDGPITWHDKEREDEAIWERRVGNMIAGRKSRTWQLEGDDQFIVTLDGAKCGEVWRHDAFSSGRLGASFICDTGVPSEKFAWWPQQEFNAFLLNEYENEGSALRRAYNWQRLNEEERTAHVTRCENGTWQEMRDLGQHVLNLNYRFGDDNHYFVDYWDLLDDEPFEYDKEVLGHWVKLFLQFFRPTHFQSDSPAFEREHWRECWEICPERLHVLPSAHEKLEAFLHLRDWLRANAPEEERLMGLFPPLGDA